MSFIAAASAASSTRAEIFEGYAKALRRIVAELHGIDGGKAKFDHAKGGIERKKIVRKKVEERMIRA